MAPSPWRDEVGLLEKHSRAKRSLFFGADEGGGVKQQRAAAFRTRHDSPRLSACGLSNVSEVAAGNFMGAGGANRTRKRKDAGEAIGRVLA